MLQALHLNKGKAYKGKKCPKRWREHEAGTESAPCQFLWPYCQHRTYGWHLLASLYLPMLTILQLNELRMANSCFWIKIWGLMYESFNSHNIFYFAKSIKLDMEIVFVWVLNDQLREEIVGTPGLGYPLLLCLGKSLVVILDYGRTAGPLQSGALSTRQQFRKKQALSPSNQRLRTSHGGPDPRGVPDPPWGPGPPE